MQSLFPSMASVGPQSSSNFVQFRAGKCHLNPLPNGKFQVSADNRKGQVSVCRENDGLLHFKWSVFGTGAVEEDRIVMPGESVFKKVKTGRETGDRVFMLKFNSGNQRLMYWMQDKDASKDEEVVKKTNDFLNNTPSSANSAIPVASSSARVTSSAPGGLDLSSLLAQFAQSQSNSQVNATPAPAARPPTATPTTGASAITIEDLRRAMMGQASPANQTPGIQDILSAEAIVQSGILEDETVRNELVAQLPLDQQSAEQLESTLRSAQLQQAMSSLTHAVSQTENFHGIASNFNLDPTASTEALARGDGVAALLDAVQSTHPPQDPDQGVKETNNDENKMEE